MPYPPYVQTVTVTNACSVWYANLRRNLLKTVDDYTTMENWEHMLKPVRFIVSSFTVSARILWKKMCQQYKEYESATWATKNSEKRWAVFDRVCGLHCSWCKSSQMKLNRRQNETSKNVIPKLRLVYFHCSFFFCVRVAKIFEGKTSMFLLLVTHIQDGVILCLPFTIFNKFLKIPNPFPQTKLCMVWKIVKSSIVLLNLTKFWTKAHAQNCRCFSPTVLRSTWEP